MKEAYLAGEENYEIPLTGFSQKKRGRGRPREIEDDELRRALLELQFVLEENWGLIGWELKHARTLGEIRAAFNAIKGFNCSRLEVFRREPTQSTTSAALRQLRKEIAAVQQLCREAYAAFMNGRESVDLGSQAFALATDDATRARLQHLQFDLVQKLHNATRAFEASQTRRDELQSKLDQQEAYFAQSQLLEFIQSGRREFTPLNIAMAMAGMPRLSARVSSERCSSLKYANRLGLTYQMFEAVEVVFAHPPATVIEAVDRMRAYLLVPRGQDRTSIAELRKNWHFLNGAIESIYVASRHPRGAMPYRIFAEYQRRFAVQSQSDVLFAQENQL